MEGTDIDIALYADVLRRHRKVVVVGVVLSIALAVLSFVQISPSGISYRSSETWANQATLVLTQEGAPELRSVLPSGPGGSSGSLADSGRFASLIDVYAALATSDAVVRELRERGLVEPVDLKDGAMPIAAAAVPSTVNASTQMMTISGTGTTAPRATRLTLGATRAFLDVLHARQVAAGIPLKDRIQVRVVKSSEAPKLVDPRSKALPVLVLLGGIIATLAIAFTRENLVQRRSSGSATATGGTSATTVHEPDPLAVASARAALGSVPDPETAPQTQQPDKQAAASSSRGRSTLGSVPRGDGSSTALEGDLPDGIARQVRRR